ncbi:MAG: bifunctional hydroxymethylpyrimidine kinase/phosphomethylpyrimidine kinase [Chloracidobacterium sp.]|nr:bifunctional hydroxymethylpyrimidine kinase/phosphomethylpyrimidine kinase [Chloracidobacterium sp.]
MTASRQKPPVCLTIAGLDPSGGAGIIADIKTFARFGCFPTAAITSVTFQNTMGVFGAVHQTADSVRRQAEAVLDDFEVAAVKTGMLPTREVIEAVAAIITERDLRNVVVDPVVRSTSGYDLIDDGALNALTKHLFPLAALITPNIPEAERISEKAIRSEADIDNAAQLMQRLGAANVLIKGGHFQPNGSERKAQDFLFFGSERTVFDADFIDTTATHGTGCTLAAAIAANLAAGLDLTESIKVAKDFVTEAIRSAPHLGHGHSPINI